MQLLFIFIVILFVVSVLLLSVANEAEVIRQQSTQYSPAKQFAYADEFETKDVKQSTVEVVTL